MKFFIIYKSIYFILPPFLSCGGCVVVPPQWRTGELFYNAKPPLCVRQFTIYLNPRISSILRDSFTLFRFTFLSFPSSCSSHLLSSFLSSFVAPLLLLGVFCQYLRTIDSCNSLLTPLCRHPGRRREEIWGRRDIVCTNTKVIRSADLQEGSSAGSWNCSR